MTEDVKPDVIKRTQELLGKHIKKPPLTEKLLKKPPFRFLHDIITSVIGGTGFLEGVLTRAEMNHQNIKDKESKIAFLQKVIDAVREATGIPLTVRPSKIVAGHEPTKTNEFLQAIGKGIEMKNGGIPTQPAKKGAKTTLPNEQSKQGASKTKLPATSQKEAKSKSLSQDRPKAKDGEKKKKMPTSSIKTRTDLKENVTRNNTNNEGPTPSQKASELAASGVLDVKPELSKPEVAESVETELEILEPVESIESLHAPPNEDVPQEVEPVRPTSANFRQRNNTLTESADISNSHDPPSTTQKEDIVQAQNIADERTENMKLRKPMSARPPSARPPSARPAAPRIRDHGEVPKTDVRPISRQVNVITENDTLDDQDTVDFLIKPKPDERGDQLIDESTSQPAEEGKHGHLVDQILETQKDLGESGLQSLPNKKMHTKKTDIEWEGGRKRDRETLKQEVTKLRELVQKTARIVNPSGKRMEFVQEDVDIMNHDMEMWLDITKQLSSQLEDEQRLTEQAVEPMKMQLVQLDEVIVEKRAQISELKATVLQNDKRIKKLLLGEMASIEK